MQHPSSSVAVAVACQSDDLAERLLLCLNFVCLEATLRSPAEPISESVILCDRMPENVSADAVLIRVSVDAGREAGPNFLAELSWPLRYDELVVALSLASAVVADRASADRALGYARQFPELVGSSPALMAVKRLMAQVADNDATVLITGESGTGKELVARCLHAASSRSDRAFVPVNCGAIPHELFESELFGHEKGAFTGAIAEKKGRFELADGGTLFLDEIGDMPVPMQVKVLRAIQERRIERIGATRSTPCDIRIIAATHRDLESSIEEALFREDLYYRLNVFPIALPPLRERREDIRPIVHQLVARLREEQGTAVTFTPEAWQIIETYPWPGNVRELGNLIQRMSIQFPDGIAGSDDLPARIRDQAGVVGTVAPLPEEVGSHIRTNVVDPGVVLPINGIDLKDFLAGLERSLIEQALADSESVVARAADRLNIRRTTLVEKMRKYGITRIEER